MPNSSHPVDCVKAAFEMQEFMAVYNVKRKKKRLDPLLIRVGLHTGPVVAGVVGTKKFAYDIWGDTVNVASRMESKSKPGKINISESTYELIKDQYDCEFRGEIDVKNKGMMKMFFVNAEKKAHLS